MGLALDGPLVLRVVLAAQPLAISERVGQAADDVAGGPTGTRQGYC